MTAPPSAPQWFTSQSGTATIPPGFTPALQHPSFHQQQQAGFGPTQFVQPMAPGPQSPTSNSKWMTGPASTQAATMHQPPLQGHYDVPAPMRLGHTTPASHHGHLIQPHVPQQLQPPQPQPTAFTSPPASHFQAPATVLNPTPTHAYIPQQQQQHQPPPPQQPPTQANFTPPTTLTPTTATPQPCTIPMQVASPAPVSATPQQQPATTQQPPQQPPTQDIPPPQPAPQQPAQGVAPAPATGGTSAAVTTDPDQRGTLPPPLRRSRSHRRRHSRAHSRSQERRRKQRQQSSPSGQRRSKRHAKHRKSRTPRRSSRDSTKQSRRQSRKHRSSPSKPRALSMDSRPRSRSPPAVVLRSYSAVHGRPRSLPQREERQNRWHYIQS